MILRFIDDGRCRVATKIGLNTGLGMLFLLIGWLWVGSSNLIN
jgi:hypothetical protein